MGPKAKQPSSGKLFQQALADQIGMEYSLVKLAGLIDWSVFETSWAEYFSFRKEWGDAAS